MKRWIAVVVMTVMAATVGWAATVTTLEFETDPLEVPANGHAHFSSKFFTIPSDGTMIQAQWEVINGPSYLLHHAWALTPEGENYLCGIPGSAIFASGREQNRFLAASSQPIVKGIHGKKLRGGQMFEIGQSLMLHNPDPFPYPDVRVRLSLVLYKPDAGGPPPVEIDALILNIGPEPHTNANFWCKNIFKGNTSEYMIPAHATETDRWKEDLVIKNPMKIYAIAAHAHDYIESLRLLVNDHPVWQAPLMKTPDGRLVEIPFTYDTGMTLKPGDRINIEAQYKNPLDKPVDAMAIVFLVFEKTGSESPIIAPPLTAGKPVDKPPPPMDMEHHH